MSPSDYSFLSLQLSSSYPHQNWLPTPRSLDSSFLSFLSTLPSPRPQALLPFLFLFFFFLILAAFSVTFLPYLICKILPSSSLVPCDLHSPSCAWALWALRSHHSAGFCPHTSGLHFSSGLAVFLLVPGHLSPPCPRAVDRRLLLKPLSLFYPLTLNPLPDFYFRGRKQVLALTLHSLFCLRQTHESCSSPSFLLFFQLSSWPFRSMLWIPFLYSLISFLLCLQPPHFPCLLLQNIET